MSGQKIVPQFVNQDTIPATIFQPHVPEDLLGHVDHVPGQRLLDYVKLEADSGLILLFEVTFEVDGMETVDSVNV